MNPHRTIEILDPGPLTTLQDRGRVGLAHLGVPRAGPLDRASATLANRLVGNQESTTLLETTMGGVVLRLQAAATVAVTGATCSVSANQRPVAHSRPLTLPAGTVLAVGPASVGVRSYVAFGGGIDAEVVLGSMSQDTLAWVGPVRLERGSVLALGAAPTMWPHVDVVVPTAPVHAVRIVAGPRVDHLAAGGWEALCSARFVVGPDSDRIGVRLQGPTIERRARDELPSEGMVLGAVQLPPSGQPVIFLADHPVTGGYPVVAVVDPRDLDACAQWRPGDVVRLAGVAQSG